MEATIRHLNATMPDLLPGVVKAALRSVHRTDKIETEVSSYYLANEIKGTYRGMMIAIPPEEWCVFHNMTFTELSQILKPESRSCQVESFSPPSTRSKDCSTKTNLSPELAPCLNCQDSSPENI